MLESQTNRRWRPSRTSLVAGGLVIAGIVLSEFSWWFFPLLALGMFGPGILRELGWLEDKDEFQRRADHRAGYHAFLITGSVAVLLVAFLRSGDREIKDPQELASLLLTLLGCSWIFSSLLAFWGPEKTVRRILYGFGCGWLAFLIASNVGSEWSGWGALLMQPLLALPFFLVGWSASRWPRVCGALLIAIVAWLSWFLGTFGSNQLGLVTRCITFLLLQGPLLACGIALLAFRREDDLDEEEGL